MAAARRTLLCVLLGAPLLVGRASASLRGTSTADGRRLVDHELIPIEDQVARQPGTVAPTAPSIAQADPFAAPDSPPPLLPTPPAANAPAPLPGGANPRPPMNATTPPAAAPAPPPAGQGGRVNANVGNAGWPVPQSWNPQLPSQPLLSVQCSLLAPRYDQAFDYEDICPGALGAFVVKTTEGAWTAQSQVQQEQTMQEFCRATPCGQAYTQALTARRRGCAVTVPDGPKDFPTSYPGLRLGCLVDPVDNLYCATKMANPAEGDCLFYKSCCYGELVSQAGGSGIDPAFLDTIDKICPGSAKYRTKVCV